MSSMTRPVFSRNCKLGDPGKVHDFSVPLYDGEASGNGNYPGPLHSEVHQCEHCIAWQAVYTTESGEWSHTVYVSFTKNSAERATIVSPNGVDRDDWQEGEEGR